MHSTVPTCKSC